MRTRDLLRFSVSALGGHRLRTGLSLLGVAIGVAAVITLTALGEGARLYVTNQFASLGTNLLIVLPGRTETTGGMPVPGGVPHDLSVDDARAIVRGIPEIDRVAPLAMGTESVAHGQRRRQVAVLGATHEMLEVRRLRLSRGAYLPESEWSRGSSVAVLGTLAAEELFPGQDPVGEIIRIGDWRMRVIGVMAPRGVQLGVNMDDVVHVPVATAMQMLNRRSLFRILIQTHDRAELDAARGKVVRLLTARHGEEDITCLTQDAVLSAFSAILDALTLALSAIAAISLSVAGIGIMNVMLVSVAERTSEVGLLKALGAGKGQILAAFLAEAVMLSTAGGLVGLAAGWGAVRTLTAVYPDLPARPPAWAVGAALALSMAVGVAFGVLPARRATRLDPVAALSRR